MLADDEEGGGSEEGMGSFGGAVDPARRRPPPPIAVLEGARGGITVRGVIEVSSKLAAAAAAAEAKAKRGLGSGPWWHALALVPGQPVGWDGWAKLPGESGGAAPFAVALDTGGSPQRI